MRDSSDVARISGFVETEVSVTDGSIV